MLHRSSHESGDGNLGANQVMSEFSSTVTEVFSEKDMNAQGGKSDCCLIWLHPNRYLYTYSACAMVAGPDTVTSVKSITKCIKILSPGKALLCFHCLLHFEIYYLALLMFPFSWICSKRSKEFFGATILFCYELNGFTIKMTIFLTCTGTTLTASNA